MKRDGSTAGKRRKVAKSGQSERLLRLEAPRSRRFEPATDAGVNKQHGPSKKSRPVFAGSDATTVEQTQGQSARRRKVTAPPVSQFDAIKVAELIEGCRAYVANLSELAGVVARTLFELYDYESDDPELWQCCRLIRQILNQTEAALMPLGLVSHDTAPHTRAEQVATGCEVQRQWLRPAVHVVRATIHVLIDVKLDHHDEVLPALRVLESGLTNAVAGLEKVIQRCLCRPDRRAAR